MCTYNGAFYLPEQLRSIASQSCLPDELVICDDRSVDNTPALLKEFADQTPFPVRLHWNETRLGPAKNFEQAIRLCGNEIIVLCDQDDIWKPEKLEILLEALNRNPDAVYAFSDADMVDHEGAFLGYNLWDSVGFRKKMDRFSGPGQVEILLKHNVIPGAAMAFRASFKSILLPFPDDWMHDYWIALLGSLLSYGVPVSDSLFKYRRHAEQVCGWRKKTFLQVLKTSFATNDEDWSRKVNHFSEVRKRIDIISAIRSCPKECLQFLTQKEDHLSIRASIRSSKGISRVIKVFAEASTGRYQLFSNSWHSIVRDLWRISIVLFTISHQYVFLKSLILGSKCLDLPC